MLDALPILGDLLATAPPRLHQQLHQAFDLQALYNKNLHQVTINVTITDSTPRAVVAIMADADHDGPAQASPEPRPEFSNLAQALMCNGSTTIMAEGGRS